MRAAIPHQLPQDEVRRRLRERTHEIADFIPGGMAKVATDWPSDDLMNLSVNALGQAITGTVVVEEHQVVLDLTLPPALSFMEPMIQNAIEAKGQKLLAQS